MGRFHEIKFPAENDAYRKARDELLDAEVDLRQRMEEVAALRRKLPLGGKVEQDYVFEEGAPDLSDENTVKETRFSELFAAGNDTLFVYSFMFDPEWEKPCSSCTSILDGLNGQFQHISQRVNMAVVAKAPLEKMQAWARGRAWNDLRLLSSNKNTYNRDYFAEKEKWGQIPAANVFVKRGDGIYHFYSTELLYSESEEGQEPRHVDLLWPLWNVFDLTPEGRGEDWHPKLSYE